MINKRNETHICFKKCVWMYFCMAKNPNNKRLGRYPLGIVVRISNSGLTVYPKNNDYMSPLEEWIHIQMFFLYIHAHAYFTHAYKLSYSIYTGNYKFPIKTHL